MKYVLLLRGINVGHAKRIAMTQLRSICEQLGCRNVKTVLQSGNLVCTAAAPPSTQRLQEALLATVGFSAEVLTVPEAQFRAIADADPLVGRTTDPARHIVTFFQSCIDPRMIDIPQALEPELIELGSDAAYQWLPDGVLQTKLPKDFWASLPTAVTARNRRTVDKLLTLL